MNPFEMVAIIVVAVMIASVMRAKYSGRRHQGDGEAVDTAEARQLREEVRALKERVIVLERIATDKTSLLEQEFDRLRDRRDD